MASKSTAIKLTALQCFFLSEVKQEVASGFSRLKRVPSSQVIDKMRFFARLNADDQHAFLDCCAYWASVQYGFGETGGKLGGETGDGKLGTGTCEEIGFW